MMRIALICRSLPCHRLGGLEWHTWDLARGLARRGHSIRILTTPVEPVGTGLRDFLAQWPDPPVEVRELGRERKGRYSISFFREAARTVRGWAREGSVDVVHAQGFGALALSPGALGKVPLVITIHGTLWSETLLGARTLHPPAFWKRSLLLWKYRHRVAAGPLYQRMLTRAALLLVDSEFTRSELLRESPELESKIQVIPLGVDLERFHPVRPETGDRRLEEKNKSRLETGDRRPEEMNKGGDVVSSADLQSPFSGLQSSVSTRRSPISGLHPLRLLALGRLEKAKGFDVILYALAGIWESGRGAHPSTPSCNWVLEIAGVGPDERRLKNLVSQLGIEERVRFIGRVPDDRLAEVFARADLFLSPDLTQPAFGLVALEAMIQGTPVLASRSGALPEVIGRDGGWLATPGDAQAWREALAILLSRPEQLEAQGRAAQHAARRFSLDRMVDGVEEAYRKALGGSRSSG